MKLHICTTILFSFIVFSGCKNTEPDTISFGADMQLLEQLPDVQILKTKNSMIAVSGALQGKVFTSSSKGMNGRSYGWFNKDIIKDHSYKNLYSRLGGEDRMWFGPQYGKFNVNCEPGLPLKEENMRNAPDLNNINFETIFKSTTEIVCKGNLQIKNYQNFVFNIEAKRRIAILKEEEIEDKLNITISENVSYVGFESNTEVKNIGSKPWQKESGLLSIWILGCIKPSDNSVAMLPFKNELNEVTNYFTPIDSTRLIIANGFVFYKSDAQYLNKIGILPENTIPKFGTYSPELNLLTIVEFSFDNSPLYVNSHNTDQSNPYGGDVINIFNDGILGDVGPFGPFYELESSSAAKELQPKETLSHKHTTYHFEGNKTELTQISKKVLGLNLSEIPKF